MAAYDGGGSDGNWYRFSGKEAEQQPGPVEMLRERIGGRFD